MQLVKALLLSGPWRRAALARGNGMRGVCKVFAMGYSVSWEGCRGASAVATVSSAPT